MSTDSISIQIRVESVHNVVCPLTKKTVQSLMDGHLFHQLPRPYIVALVVKNDGASIIVDGVALQAFEKTYEKVHYFIVRDKKIGFVHFNSFGKESSLFEQAIVLAGSCEKSPNVTAARKFLLFNKCVSTSWALDICEQMLVDDPNDAFALSELGNISRINGDLENAEKFLMRALEIDRSCTFSWTSLACLCQHKGLQAEAYALFSKALGKQPEDIEIQRLFEDFLQQDTALVRLRANLGYCMDLVSIHTVLGEIYKQMDQNKKAIQHFQAAQRLAPENGCVLALLGNSLRKEMINEDVTEKSLDQVQKYFEAAITCGYDNSFVRSRLADVYRMQKKHDEAYFQCKLALELNPSNAFTHMQLGTFAMDAMQFDLAEIHFKNLIALKPSWTVSYEMLGTLRNHEKVGSEEAQSLYEKAIALDPNNKNAVKKLQKVIQERSEENAIEQFLI